MRLFNCSDTRSSQRASSGFQDNPKKPPASRAVHQSRGYSLLSGCPTGHPSTVSLLASLPQPSPRFYRCSKCGHRQHFAYYWKFVQSGYRAANWSVQCPASDSPQQKPASSSSRGRSAQLLKCVSPPMGSLWQQRQSQNDLRLLLRSALSAPQGP